VHDRYAVLGRAFGEAASTREWAIVAAECEGATTLLEVSAL
jgi:hypothetical protein